MNNKKKILLITANAVLLILIAVCFLQMHSYSRVLLGQQAAEYWAGDSEEPFAQVSCFFPETKLAATDSIFAFRKTIGAKLADTGIKAKEEGEYWTDCYSAEDSLTVAGDRNSSEATVIGVGGDFFLFHPYELVSGSYLSEDDVMKDRVILDYELAWKLFGGTSLEGMSVTINGTPYYVAGVVRRETDKFSTKAFSDEPVMFMSYSTLASLKEGTGISCYELAMPDPISNYTENFVQESFKTAGGVAVENSARYEFSSIFKMLKDFGSRSIYNSGVVYPYWENAARISEVYVARLYVFVLLLALFPLICLIVIAVRLIKRLVAKLKHLKDDASEAWDDRYAREAAWKERRANKRINKNLSRHESNKKRNVKTPARTPAEPEDPIETEITPDIESIVREILDGMKGPETKV